MKIIHNNIIPFRGFIAINLFGVLFIKKRASLTERISNHEAIHTAQMKELFYIFFYILYILEWFVKLFIYGSRSYYHISFEKEAYRNDQNLDYLKSRKKFAWLK